MNNKEEKELQQKLGKVNDLIAESYKNLWKAVKLSLAIRAFLYSNSESQDKIQAVRHNLISPILASLKSLECTGNHIKPPKYDVLEEHIGEGVITYSEDKLNDRV